VTSAFFSDVSNDVFAELVGALAVLFLAPAGLGNDDESRAARLLPDAAARPE
jgi:hypothetical protein